MSEKILVIDDELDMLALLRMIIEDNTDYRVDTTNNPSEGLKMIIQNGYNLVISDLKMPGMDALELYDEVREVAPDLPMIIITAYGSLETSDEAMRKGVSDFITKPFRKDNILFTINRVLELARIKRENILLREQLREKG